MEYHTILTVATSDKKLTTQGVLTVNGDATRASIFKYLRDQIVRQNGPQFADATVVFFSAEPNRLGG